MESKRLYKKLENVGYDILYSGLHQTPEMILDVSLSFDADVKSRGEMIFHPC
jgi:methylmalonyl-CoA mutase cobalamin-binding subunit